MIAVVVVAAAYAYRGRRGRHEGFAADPAPEVHRAVQELFQSNKAATYSDYKAAVPGADPVQYADMRRLWLANRLTVDAVRQAL